MKFVLLCTLASASILLLNSCCSGLGMAYIGSCAKPSHSELEAGRHCAEPGMVTRDARYVKCMKDQGFDVEEDPAATLENERRRSNKSLNADAGKAGAG